MDNEPVSEPEILADAMILAEPGAVSRWWASPGMRRWLMPSWLTDLLRRARAQDETLTVEERQLIEPLRETGGTNHYPADGNGMGAFGRWRRR
ncbi:MAG: hypothetical protein V9G20_22970 [Candidatus Promineifilaceae bacterium]